MRRMRVVLSVLVIGYIDPGFAMRCQQSLVYEGDSKYTVEKKCGEPLSKETFDDPEIIYNQYDSPYGVVANTYEMWTYQKSSTDFLYEILFQDGVVKSIKANRSF